MIVEFANEINNDSFLFFTLGRRENLFFDWFKMRTNQMISYLRKQANVSYSISLNKDFTMQRRVNYGKYVIYLN
jgi:hypothetical protein